MVWIPHSILHTCHYSYGRAYTEMSHVAGDESRDWFKYYRQGVPLYVEFYQIEGLDIEVPRPKVQTLLTPCVVELAL